MKQRRKTKPKKTTRTASKEPLAEGIIVPLDKQGRRSWKSMSDDEIVKYAKNFIKEKGIKSRGRLQKEDYSLYDALRKRKLLDRLEFEVKKKEERNWKSMSDDEIVVYAQRFIEENEIKNRSRLQKVDQSLYQVLRTRGLLDRLEFEKVSRDWDLMTDGEVIGYTMEVIEACGITERTELQLKDNELYKVLERRNILDLVFFEQTEERHSKQDVFDLFDEFDSS